MGTAGLHGYGWTIEDNLEKLEPTGIACNRTVPAARSGQGGVRAPNLGWVSPAALATVSGRMARQPTDRSRTQNHRSRHIAGCY
jgi:hypothetical protein